MNSKLASMNAKVLTSNDTIQNNSHKVALDSFVSLMKVCSLNITLQSRHSEQQLNEYYDIYFIDLFHCDWSEAIPNNILQLAKHNKVVLFNVHNEQLCERQLLLSGFQGIFYLSDRSDIILKGLNEVKNNERWFKRSSMNQAFSYLLKKNKSSISTLDKLTDKVIFPTLTKRENTIIDLVTKGSKNHEIADQLNISTNTVKTHIYSIFRKTNSRNRIELITWSLQSTKHIDPTLN
ncbi:helix-turn-helix transcriptional regulator [Pseudoalteromonas phenolica]|uniref:helix-turn-helix transcriptional regulator n=1 Tax=Pseudoalteromonas phenolica TaxID=161398 RepID=UPI00110B5E30|nr:response regulator transcription factor [Pseudoalteromonas phenolica]TMN89601.1 helix-turn-helix transcriptional regulator [Pseudoalteromonas phenolica]